MIESSQGGAPPVQGGAFFLLKGVHIADGGASRKSSKTGVIFLYRDYLPFDIQLAAPYNGSGGVRMVESADFMRVQRISGHGLQKAGFATIKALRRSTRRPRFPAFFA